MRRIAYLFLFGVLMSVPGLAEAETTLTISGYIAHDPYGRDGIPSVTVSTDNGGGSTTTDQFGHYTVTVAYGWSGRVTPTKEGYQFTPAYQDYSSVTVNQTEQNYIGALFMLATPTFSPDGGTYADCVDVAINCDTSGATIHYTTDDSVPTENSPIYTGLISIVTPTTLRAKAFKTNWVPSSTTTAHYYITASTPTFAPPGGGFSAPVMVTITCVSPGAVIHYTQDGTEPTENSDLYTEPIVSENTVLRAKAWAADKNPSRIKTEIYATGAEFVDDPNLLDNRSFEEGNSFLTLYDFIPPLCWKRIPYLDSIDSDDCYAGLHNSFELQSCPWTIGSAYEGSTFVLLSTGGFNGIPDRDIRGSRISQRVYLSAGDTITGTCFFGTTDYMPFNDYAQISLEPAGEPGTPSIPATFVIPGTYCNVETVGSSQSTGWISFSYTIEPDHGGDYYLCCEVSDIGDPIFNSYYAIDGLRICRGGKPDSDLDYNCGVDLVDFAYLANYWGLDDCDGLDDCGRADIDGSGDVGVGDLAAVAEDWLK